MVVDITDKTRKEYERIQKYAASLDEIGARYCMDAQEITAIYECSPDIFSMINITFRLGFEKGCRKTRKAMLS